jgi:iron-sulfur cluster assembly protein
MTITLTERAARHVQKQLALAPDAQGLRLSVKPTGCSGYSYVVKAAETVTPEDTVIEVQGVRLVVDRGSLPFLEGTEVDFAREGLNEGFKFNNPNVKATCGCGESFTV